MNQTATNIFDIHVKSIKSIQFNGYIFKIFNYL